MSDRVHAAAGPRWAKRLPGARLSEWVAVMWYSAGDRGGRTRERLLPRGTVELVIELGPEQTSIIGPDRRIDVDPVSVVGASPRPFVLERPNRFETIGVIFRPGAAIALLGVSADELGRAPLPLGLLWGAAAAELRERAVTATGPDEKLAAVERVLAEQLLHVERARRYYPAIAAMAHIAAAPERCSIADLSGSVGISSRRLEETFRVVVGLTPKRFSGCGASVVRSSESTTATSWGGPRSHWSTGTTTRRTSATSSVTTRVSHPRATSGLAHRR